MWVSSKFSGFLPQSKDMRIRSTAYSKLPRGVNLSVVALRWIGALSWVITLHLELQYKHIEVPLILQEKEKMRRVAHDGQMCARARE